MVNYRYPERVAPSIGALRTSKTQNESTFSRMTVTADIRRAMYKKMIQNTF